jgi:hypothetical protein
VAKTAFPIVQGEIRNESPISARGSFGNSKIKALTDSLVKNETEKDNLSKWKKQPSDPTADDSKTTYVEIQRQPSLRSVTCADRPFLISCRKQRPASEMTQSTSSHVDTSNVNSVAEVLKLSK